MCRDGALVELFTVERLLAASPPERIGDLMDASPPVVPPGADQEHVAWQVVQHAEPGLAVVDDAGRFVGLIPPRRLLAVPLEEHDEDLARLGGFLSSTASARTASTEPIGRRLWHRLPWLLVGLLGARCWRPVSWVPTRKCRHGRCSWRSSCPSGLHRGRDRHADRGVGDQGLSVGVGIGRGAVREVVTGVFLGAVLACLAFPVILLVWGDPRVAWAVAMASPWLFHRLGRDPAFGSGPLAAVVQDLLPVLI